MKTRTAILVLAIALAGCKKAGTQQEKVFPVKTAPVTVGYIATTMTVMGTVDSRVHAWAQATAEGTIQSLAVAEGNQVSEGQVLCYIMPQDSQNMLGQARLEYERVKRAAVRNKDDEARIKVQEAEREYNLAKNLFKRIPITAPVSGTVISKTVENGTTVAVKQPLIEIADLGRLIVKTAVSEDVVSKLRSGQKVKVTLYSETDKSFMGTISMVTPGVNFQTRTAGVEISIPQRREIKPGMTCAVEFVTAARSGAVIVPLEAIIADLQGNKKVFTVKEGKAVAIPIVTGIEDNTRAEVISGVSPGDEIVVMGQDNLKNGVKVKIAMPGGKKENKKEDKGGGERMP